MASIEKFRIVLLFVTFGNDHCADAVSLLQSLSNSLFSREIDLILRVDNSQTPLFDTTGPVPQSNNFAADFSGWHTAVEIYKRNGIQKSDLVIFANDSFHRNFGTGVLKYFLEFGGEKILKHSENGIVGIMDDFPRPVKILNHSGQRWIRSNFYFTRGKQIDNLIPFSITPENADKILNPDPKNLESLFREQSPISSNYRAYMERWLLGKIDSLYPEYTMSWLKAEPLTEKNFHELIRKMRAILSEHTMSFRAAERGLLLVNVNPEPWRDNRHTEDPYLAHKFHYPPLSIEELVKTVVSANDKNS